MNCPGIGSERVHSIHCTVLYCTEYYYVVVQSTLTVWIPGFLLRRKVLVRISIQSTYISYSHLGPYLNVKCLYLARCDFTSYVWVTLVE